MKYKMSWIGYSLFIIILGVSLWVWKSGSNQALFYAINSKHTLLPTFVWTFLNFCTYPKYYILPIILLIITFIYKKEALARVILVIISYYIVFHLLKIIVAEARPYIILPSGSFFWVPTSAAAKIAYESFPSGHVGLTTVFAFTLMQIFCIRNFWLKLLLLIFIVLIACARICSGWHWPLDILASSLIGFILVKLCFINYKTLANS